MVKGVAVRNSRRSTDLAIAAVVIFGLAFVLILTPEGDGGEINLTIWGLRVPTICWLKTMLDVPCAACGLTRSFVLLVHGNWNASIQQHPFGPAVLGFAILQLPPRIAGASGLRCGWMDRWDRVFGYFLVAMAFFMAIWWATTVMQPLLMRTISAAVTGYGS